MCSDFLAVGHSPQQIARFVSVGVLDGPWATDDGP